MEQVWRSDKVDQLAAAIVNAQNELEPVKKECENPFYHSKYADLSACWAALGPFTEHGIAIIQCPMPAPPGMVAIETELLHLSGQWLRSRIELPLAKHDPQGAGSAITYARRYALGCMTGLVTEEDDDANATVQPEIKENPHYFRGPISQPPAPAAPPTGELTFGKKAIPLSQLSLDNCAWWTQYLEEQLQKYPHSKYSEDNMQKLLAVKARKRQLEDELLPLTDEGTEEVSA